MQTLSGIPQTSGLTATLIDPVADIESQEQLPEAVDFTDLYDLITATENLNTQGEPLVQLIQSIEESTQALLRIRSISQEKMPQVKQGLRSLLTFIEPNIGEYIGTGLVRNDYDTNSLAFLNHFNRIERISISKIGAFLFLFSCFAALYFIIEGADKLDGTYDHHNVDHRKKLRHEGTIQLAVAVPYMFFYIVAFRSVFNFYLNTPDDSEENILRDNVKTAVNSLYLNYCTSRKRLSCFRRNELEQPKYFYELAAKLFAEMLIIDAANGYALDNEKIIETLRVFSSSTTSECLKFNRMLNESTSDNMVICINRLLEVQIIQTSNLEWLTLRADHIFGANAAEFMHDYIDELREQMGLKPWEWPALPSALENTGSAMMSSRNPLHHPTATGVLTAVAVTFYGPRNGVPTATACSKIDEESQPDDAQTGDNTPR